MKTELRRVIDSEASAQKYISELIANGELYHFEDSACDVVWQSEEQPTEEECVLMNSLADKCFEYMEDPLQYALDIINSDTEPIDLETGHYQYLKESGQLKSFDIKS